MKAGKRLARSFGVAALMLAAVSVRAQETPPPPADAPADPIGPSELENFSVNGTVTREAEQPAEPAATAPRPTPQPAAPANRVPSAPSDDSAARSGDRTRASSPSTADDGAASAPAASPSAAPTMAPIASPLLTPSPSVTVALPPLDGRISTPAADLAGSDDGGLATGQLFTQWPWLLAVLALILGGLFLWRSRSRPAYANWSHGDDLAAPQVDALAAPEPAQRPAAPAASPTAAQPGPSPAPPPAAFFPTPPVGVVSTSLRPQVELHFSPLQFTVDVQHVMVDFEIELLNNGSAPARAVLVETSLFNASPSQDQVINAFFGQPASDEERIPLIAPLKRLTLRSQVVAPRDRMQLFKVGERELFVPLIAFNAFYRWGSAEGQTSSAFILGSNSSSDKLAPFRADLGARRYRNVGARQLPYVVNS